MKLHYASLAIPLLVAACGAAPSPGVGVEETRRAIINGVKSGADDDAAVGIGIFTTNGQFAGACSGVLVAPNLVLTARHCVSDTDEGALCNSDGTPIYQGQVYGDHEASQLKILVGADLSFDFAATGTQILHPDADNLCNSDIAMLVVDQDITSVPFAQIRLDKPPTTDESIRAVGWGTANNSNNLERRKRDDIPIVAVGPDDNNGLGDNEFQIGEGICSGDSGGPAFVETTKAVVGIVSRGGNGAPYNPQKDPPYTECVDSSKYTTFNIYTRTDGFKDFILSGFAAAGKEPWVEGGPDPRKAKFGESCGTDDDCRSAVCLSGKAPMCSQSCDAQTLCPDGFTCKAQNGRNICQQKHKGCAVGGDPVSTVPSLVLAALALALVARRRGYSS